MGGRFACSTMRGVGTISSGLSLRMDAGASTRTSTPTVCMTILWRMPNRTATKWNESGIGVTQHDPPPYRPPTASVSGRDAVDGCAPLRPVDSTVVRDGREVVDRYRLSDSLDPPR